MSYSCWLLISKCSFLSVIRRKCCFRVWKKSHRLGIVRKGMVAWPIHFVAFDVCWWKRESDSILSGSLTASENVKKRKSVWRRSIYRKYVSRSWIYRTLHSYNLIWAVCHLFPQRWRTLNVQSRETIGQEDHVICLQLRRRVNSSSASWATYKKIFSINTLS